MRLTTWHIQGFERCKAWLVPLLNDTYDRKGLPKRLKMIDPPLEDPFGGRFLVTGRTFVEDNESERLIKMGAMGADIWVSRNLSTYESRTWVHDWEGPNEPQIPYEPAPRELYLCAFEVFTERFCTLMHDLGYKVVVGNFGVGHPDVGIAARLARVLGMGDYLGLHEYGKPTVRVVNEQGEDDWYTLRYRRTHAEIEGAGYTCPPIIIGECGIDGLLWDGPRWGWQHYATEEEYADQLSWYDAECQREGWIVATMPFTAGATDVWLDGGYDVTEGLSNRIADQLTQAPPVPPEFILHDIRADLSSQGKYPWRDLGQIKRIVIHHSGPPGWLAGVDAAEYSERIANYHIQRWGWEGIGYHVVNGPAGMACWTQALRRVSNHVSAYSKTSVGICLLGDYRPHKDGNPTEAQLWATQHTIDWVRERVGKDLPIVGHKELYHQNACPGTNWGQDHWGLH